MHDRQIVLTKWLKQTLPSSVSFSLASLTGDASFRTYYRLTHDNSSYVVLDAPPDKENLQPFLELAKLLRTQGLYAPVIHAVNEEEGFALLEDLGDDLLLRQLSPASADSLYKSAIQTLLQFQEKLTPKLYPFPLFDETFIAYELQLFFDWFLKAYLKIDLTSEEITLIQRTFAWLTDEIIKLPQTIVHRDYHARNIMIKDKTTFALIDFQDAMLGPVPYDLVSLLKDCYIQWPREQIMNWLRYFYEQSPLTKAWSLTSFIHAFDICGLQRHLKVLGIFCRLYLRDKKPNYLKDLPLTLHYVMAYLESSKELRDFYLFMQKRVQLP